MARQTRQGSSSARDVAARVDVLGVPVAPWDADGLVEALIATATGAAPPGEEPLRTVHYANVHVLNTAYRNPALRRHLAAASTVYCDGSGVRLGAALLGQRLPPRLTAPDWIDLFCDRAARAGVRPFIVAGAGDVAQRAATVLCARHPGLDVAGTHHGYLDDSASQRVVARANDAHADVLIVGMGTPLQELWVARHRNDIRAPVVWTVGALFDFVAGVQWRAPGWLRRVHLEWLWRVGTAPRRLTGRYLVGNLVFVFRVLRQRVGGIGFRGGRS
jgi:N-acetylglucosaminyldiphosphoundecaprenol N-acetyl-beta-D-mannosaminyltransferase